MGYGEVSKQGGRLKRAEFDGVVCFANERAPVSVQMSSLPVLDSG